MDRDDNGHQVFAASLAGEAFTRGARLDKERNVLTGFFAPADREGFLLFNLKEATAPFFEKLEARVEYRLPDGTTLHATHIIAEVDNPSSPSWDTPDRRIFYEANEASSFATHFSNVPAVKFG